MPVRDKNIARLRERGWLREANRVGPEWVGAEGGATRTVQDLATGAMIGTIPWAGATADQGLLRCVLREYYY